MRVLYSDTFSHTISTTTVKSLHCIQLTERGYVYTEVMTWTVRNATVHTFFFLPNFKTRINAFSQPTWIWWTLTPPLPISSCVFVLRRCGRWFGIDLERPHIRTYLSHTVCVVGLHRSYCKQHLEAVKAACTVIAKPHVYYLQYEEAEATNERVQQNYVWFRRRWASASSLLEVRQVCLLLFTRFNHSFKCSC